MERICFVADSNSDIPTEICKELDIRILPFSVEVDGRHYVETISFTPLEYYEILENAKEIPKTSGLSPTAFLECFCSMRDEGFDCLICTTMASVGSSTYSAAVIAREWFYEQNPSSPFRIHIVDSKNYSIAYGWGVVSAARLYREGRNDNEILSFMETWFDRLVLYFVPFKLKYIKKSGRISAGVQIVGDALGIKPIIAIKYGEFINAGRARGIKPSLGATLDIFAEKYVPGTDYILMRGISIAEVEYTAAIAEEIAGRPPAVIFFCGPTITTNTGPYGVGLGYQAKK